MAQPDFSQIEQLIARDPDFQALFTRMNSAPAYLAPRFAAELDQLFKQKGINFTMPPHYGFGADGKIHQDAWLNRHGDQLGVALAAGGIGGSAFVGGGAAAGAAGEGAGMLPSTAIGSSTPFAAPAVTSSMAGAGSAGTAAGVGAAAGSIWRDLLPTIIGSGAAVGGAAIASHGNTEAAKIQARATQAGIDELRREFDLQRSDLAGYRDLGTAALGDLAYLSGHSPTPAGSTTPAPPATPPTHVTQGGQTLPDRTRPPDVPSTGTAMPRQTLASLGSPTTNVRGPDGQVYQIPNAQLSQALAAGGQQV